MSSTIETKKNILTDFLFVQNITDNLFLSCNRLLAKPRQCINREMSEFDWDPHFADSEGFIKSCVSDIYGDRAIFPIHNTLKTESTSDADQNFKRIHCSELHHIAQL